MFISFIPAISIAPLQVLYTQRRSRLQHGYCIGVSRRSAQATAGKGLAQRLYMAPRTGVEPTTLRLKAIDLTKAPPCPINYRVNRSLMHINDVNTNAVKEIKLHAINDKKQKSTHN